jgi:peroxiredoxin
MRRYLFLIAPLLFAASAAILTSISAADVKTLAISASAPDFRLLGVDGKTYTLADFSGAKVLVVVFTCNHCPTAQAYEVRIANFYAAYKDKGVAVVAISPNDPKAVRLDELGYTDLGDSFEDMKIRARDHKFTYPYLYDGETQATAKAYGVLATPHVYVFDSDRKLRYIGRFDDSEVKTVKSHDTINAVNALLQGKDVPVPTTRVFGCSTKWAEKQADAERSIEKWNTEPVKLETITDDTVGKLVRSNDKGLLLVNVWATWCGPCVTELPEFVTIQRMYRHRGLRVVTISLDEPDKREAALKILREHHVSGTNFILQTENRDRFFESLDKKAPGPLPYTLLVGPGGKILYRKVNEIEPLALKRAIVAFLGRTY